MTDTNEPLHQEVIEYLEEQQEMSDVVNGRQAVYGDKVEGMVRIAQVWSGILGITVKPAQVPLLMMGMKLVRTSETPDYSDNSDDIEGYLDIFRSVVGPDMIKARNVADYTKRKAERGDLL